MRTTITQEADIPDMDEGVVTFLRKWQCPVDVSIRYDPGDEFHPRWGIRVSVDQQLSLVDGDEEAFWEDVDSAQIENNPWYDGTYNWDICDSEDEAERLLAAYVRCWKAEYPGVTITTDR